MNRLFFAVVVAVSVCFGTYCGCDAAPADVKVVVCGEARVGEEAKAEVDARQKAVGRVLTKMLTPNKDPNSLFQQMVRREKEFTGELNVMEKKEDGGKVYIISSVLVKSGSLQEALNSSISKVQEREQDSEACFLIRLRGISTAEELAGGRTVYNAYKDSFEQLGFKIVGWEDELFQEFKSYKDDDFATFSHSLEDKIKQDFPEITVAIIGEIEVTPISQDGAGLLVGGNVNIRSLDMLRQKEIATFADTYQIKWPDPKEAGMVVVHKSAINSATALADKTLSYWQNMK